MKAPILAAGGIGRYQAKWVVVGPSRRGYADAVEIGDMPVDIVDPPKKRRRELHDIHPFKGIEEYGLFHSLFFNTPSKTVYRGKKGDFNTPAGALSFVQQIKRLREIEEHRVFKQQHSGATAQSASPLSFFGNQINKNFSQWNVQQSRFSQPLAGSVLSPENVDKIIYLMKDSNTRTLTPSDLDNWLKLNIIFTDSTHVTQQLLQQSIDEMIKHSSQTSLPVVIEFLRRYWALGFEGVKSNSVTAKNQVIKVFARALTLLPPSDPESSEFSLGAYKDLFEDFLSIYEWKGLEELQDWWFRVVAQSGPTDMTDKLMYQYYIQQQKLPSREATDLFIQALIRKIDAQRLSFPGTEDEFVASIKNDLTTYRSLLVSSQVTPSVVQFLLMWTTNLDEVYSVLETAMNSEHADRIMASCQVPILQHVVRCSLNADKKGPEAPGLADPTYFVPIHAKAMAHMFGCLNRFTKFSKGISTEALDECLVLSAKHGNSAGMYRAISMRLALDENAVILPEVISQVFDQFPIASGAMAQEPKKDPSLWFVNGTVVSDVKRDQVILYHLRTMINVTEDTAAYQKYIGALGRCRRPDRLYWEWEELCKTYPDNWIERQDLVLEFLSAHRAAGSVEAGIDILRAVMDVSATPTGYTPAVSVIKHAFRYEALPLSTAVKEVALALTQKSAVSKRWLGSDVESIFEEVTSVLHISHQLASFINTIRDGGDIQNSMNSLQEILNGPMY